MKKRKRYNSPASTGIGVLLLLFFLMAISSLRGLNNLFDPERHPSSDLVFAQVSGDIRFPGVYGFDHPPSVRNLVNRAERVAPDGKMVRIPAEMLFDSGTHAEIKDNQKEISFRVSKMLAFYRTTLGIPVSINSETADGLTAVPGIGPRTAEAIVRERSKRGRFERLSDIMSVRGIGPELYRRIRPYLALDEA